MKKIFLTLLAVVATFTLSAQYKAPLIVTNGGYYKHPSSGVKNTMSALKAAQKQKVYASECDVNITKDGKILVIRTGWHPSRKSKPRANVNKSTAKKVLAIPYKNGERVSTLEEFLARVAKKPATKLLINISNQSNIKRETNIVKKTVNIVKNAGMENQVEYLSSHPWTCFELVKYAPNSRVYYWGGNYDPLYIKGMGCYGFGCNISKLKKNQTWLAMARRLGMPVNAWVVDNEIDMRWCIQNGVDIITTSNPVLAKKVVKSMCSKSKKKKK